VLVPSGNNNHFSSFHDETKLSPFFLPVLSIEEAIAFGIIYGSNLHPFKMMSKRMQPLTEPDKIKAIYDQVVEEFKVVGGTPGYLFDGFDYGKDKMKISLNAIDFVELKKIFTLKQNIMTWDSVNRNLLHIMLDQTDENDELISKAIQKSPALNWENLKKIFRYPVLAYGSSHIEHIITNRLDKEQRSLQNRLAFAKERHLTQIAWRTFERLEKFLVARNVRGEISKLRESMYQSLLKKC
jgi:hypothetical protein